MLFRDYEIRAMPRGKVSAARGLISLTRALDLFAKREYEE